MIEHSTVEIKSWSTKLKRIGEKSSQDKEIIFNNVGHIICREWLEKIYQQMPGKKAVGMDGITKEMYGKDLQQNLDKLMIKIRRGQYQPQPARIVEIPKEDGSTRPLAISCFEDKLVQQAVADILSVIFEPLFLDCSYGFRASRNCHDALKYMTDTMFQIYDGAVVEIDIRKCFNTIPHKEMEEFLARKISDSRFLRLIKILMKTPILQDGKVTSNDCGCPQGSIISPVLSNIYLHYVIDKWFSDIRTHLKYEAYEIRYADDGAP